MKKTEKAEKILEAIDEYAPISINWNNESRWICAILKGFDRIEDAEKTEEIKRKEVAIQAQTPPRMLTLRQAAEETGLAYEHLRRLCLKKRIPNIKAGKKYLVNLGKLIEYLNAGEQEE